MAEIVTETAIVIEIEIVATVDVVTVAAKAGVGVPLHISARPNDRKETEVKAKARLINCCFSVCHPVSAFVALLTQFCRFPNKTTLLFRLHCLHTTIRH